MGPRKRATQFWLPLAALLAGLAMVACGGDGAGPAPQPSATARSTTTATLAPTATHTPTARRPTAEAPPTPTPRPEPPPTVPPSGSARVIRKGDTTQRLVALTFDAGADTGFTAQILDTLAAQGIRASFGITGRWVEQNPGLLRRIAQEGHELINHSYSHPSFTGFSTGEAPLTRAQRWEQLDRTETIVRDLTGRSTKPYFRPPYGDYDESVNADIFARGYRYNVMWTVDSLGWQGPPASEIAQRCLRLVEPGAIYLFHVGAASQDAAALQAIIAGLRERGYRFVPVSQLIGP